jgi:hypothetical protein
MDNYQRTYWLVGQFRKETPDGVIWDFQGIFQSESQAVEACRDENYFVAPVVLDCEIEHEKVRWDGWWPKQKD